MEIVQTALITPENPDIDLLRRARSGDAQAFNKLYRSRGDAVYRYALHMSGNPSIAEEVLQDTFIALLKGGNTYDPSRGPLSSYIYGIARNRVRRHVALGREFDEPDAEIASDSDLLVDLTRRETIELVRRAVLALPGVYREAIVLCELQELSYEEAADVVGCPVGTVRSRLHRARAMLLSKLQAQKRNRCLV